MLLHSCGGRIINPVGHKDILNAVARNQARHAPARRHGQKNHCDKKSRSHGFIISFTTFKKCVRLIGMFRKTFFVKPKLQLKYLLVSLLIVVITSASILFVVTQTLIHSDRLSQFSPGEVQNIKNTILGSFGWILGILLLAIGAQSVLFFHRFIGPLYVIEKMLGLMGQGRIGGHIHLRHGDELKELGEAAESLAQNLSVIVNEDRTRARFISRRLEEMVQAEPRLKEKIEKIQAEISQLTGKFQL